MTSRLKADLLADLSARIEAVVGPAWNVAVSARHRRCAATCFTASKDAARRQIPIGSPEPDKILLVAVTVVPGGLLVTARDFDVHTRTLSYPVTRHVWQIGSLCDAGSGRAAFGLRRWLASIASSMRTEKPIKVKRTKEEEKTRRRRRPAKR